MSMLNDTFLYVTSMLTSVFSVKKNPTKNLSCLMSYYSQHRTRWAQNSVSQAFRHYMLLPFPQIFFTTCFLTLWLQVGYNFLQRVFANLLHTHCNSLIPTPEPSVHITVAACFASMSFQSYLRQAPCLLTSESQQHINHHVAHSKCSTIAC